MVDHEMVTDHLIYFIVDRVFHVTIYHIRGKFDWMAVFDYHSPSIYEMVRDDEMKKYHFIYHHHLESTTISSHPPSHRISLIQSHHLNL